MGQWGGYLQVLVGHAEVLCRPQHLQHHLTTCGLHATYIGQKCMISARHVHMPSVTCPTPFMGQAASGHTLPTIALAWLPVSLTGV